jgi:hypothetical protein
MIRLGITGERPALPCPVISAIYPAARLSRTVLNSITSRRRG